MAEALDNRPSSDRALESARQLADRVRLTKGAVERLLNQGKLEFVIIGARKYIPAGAWQNFILNNTVKPSWAEETKVQSANGLKRENVITSSGLKTVAAASAARARQTAQKLKSSSRNGSNAAHGEPAQVIHLKRS